MGLQMTKRVVAYVRCSTKEQDTTRQIEELREIAANHNWELVDVYCDEGISGALKSRPELDRMLKDAFRKRFDLVMTLEMSRLGRSTKNLLEIVETLESKKIDLFIVNQQIDTSTPAGALFFTIAAAFATYERDIIRERVISGISSARKKGRIGGNKSNLTEANRKKVIELREAGTPVKKIAKECRLGLQTVYKVLNAA